ncbi:MAG TPA: BTAD domain-containing putative transcriptional regulator [Gemmatimonadaceae bacterium]
MLSLRLFGGLSLSNPGSTIPPRANQRRRLALLAILGVSSGKPVSRDKLAVLLWPDADAEHARHLLSDSLYVLRSALGDRIIIASGENVSINLELVRVDVAEFARAIERGDYGSAVEIRNGGGPFLDGIHLPDSLEFERWVDGVRTDLTVAYHDALKQLARACSAAGDRQGAATWWRRVAAEDPLSSNVALELMRALEAAGDRGAALSFARVYENLVRSELDSPPDPSIAAFVEQLRNDRGDSRPPTRLAIRPVPAKSESPPQNVQASLHGEAIASGRKGRRLLTPGYVGALLVVIAGGLYGVWRAHPEVQPVAAARTVRPASTDYRLRYRTTNRTAYDLYLRGRQHRELRSAAGFRAAVKDYSAAIELDSNYAEAYAGLSEAYTLLMVAAEYDKDPPLETARKAEAAALKAVALADSLGEAHMVLGVFHLHGPTEFADAERELVRARSLDPTDPRTREYLIGLHCWTGRQDQALTEARAIVAADQMSLGARRELGRALYTSRRYEEAIVEFDRMQTVGITTPVRMAPVMAAETYDVLGLYSNALAELAGKPSHYVRALTGYTLARMGNRAGADSVLADLRTHWSRGRGGAFEVAVVYAGMRDFNAAFAWLAKSFDDRSIRSEIMDPLFDDLRADPRFAAMRVRLGLKREAGSGKRVTGSG